MRTVAGAFVCAGSGLLRRRSAGSLTENVANRDKICDYHKKTKNMERKRQFVRNVIGYLHEDAQDGRKRYDRY